MPTLPTDVAGLYFWLKADAITGLADGAALGTWSDSSGSGRDFEGQGGAKYRINMINAKPAIELDGVDDHIRSVSTTLDCPAFTFFIIFKSAVHSSTVGRMQHGTSANIYVAHNSIVVTRGATVTSKTYTPRTDDAEWHYQTWRYDGFHSGNRTWVDGSEAAYTDVSTGDPGTGALSDRYNLGFYSAYMQGWIAEFFLYNSVLSDTNRENLQQYLLDKYFTGQNVTDPPRTIASQGLRLFRKPVAILEATVPFAKGGVDLLDPVAITHRDLPHPTGLGAGYKNWERYEFYLLDTTLDPDALNYRWRLMALRAYKCTFWDTMYGEETARDPLYHDSARLMMQTRRSLQRTSNAYIEDPPDRRVIEVSHNTEKNTADGLLLESARANYVLRSSLVNGTTGLTLNGTGGGATIAVDTADLLFDSAVTANSLKLTAASPLGGTDLEAVWPATSSLNANSIMRLSIDHKDDSSAVLSWTVQRGVDSNWWRDSDSTWQAAKTWNTWTASTTKVRDQSKQINVGAGATTLTVSVGARTTAGQINHVYHVQLEEGKYKTSRMVTQTAIFERKADALLIGNDHDVVRTWPIERGTCEFTFIPEWNATEIGTDVKTLLLVRYDADNYDWVFYQNSNLYFRRRFAGVNYDAENPTVFVAGTAYRINPRWTGRDSELDLAQYQLTLFVDGGPFIDVASGGVVSGPPTTMDMWIGHDSSSGSAATVADGWFRYFSITPDVLTAEEIAQ